MSESDYRIWSNADLDYEEWKDWMEEEYPTLSEDERVAMMYEENGHYLEDERLNLDNTTVYRLNELVTKVSNARTGLLFASILGENAQTVEVTIKVR